MNEYSTELRHINTQTDFTRVSAGVLTEAFLGHWQSDMVVSSERDFHLNHSETVLHENNIINKNF